MNKISMDKVCKIVYRRFPALNHKRPKVTSHGENRYLLIFSGSGKTPDGKTITNTVRVVSDDEGKIIKTSMSR